MKESDVGLVGEIEGRKNNRKSERARGETKGMDKGFVGSAFPDRILLRPEPA